MKRITCLLVPLIVVVFYGCGSKKIGKDKSAEEIYQEVEKELQEESGGFPWIFTGRDYDTIFKQLKEIQLRYTYSPYATLAELLTADAYFQEEEYAQAAIEYEEFLKRHPGHDKVPYTTYRLALSHYKQIKSYDQDHTNTREAIKWFEIFVRDYPDSPLVEDAYEKISKCHNKLARRDIYIGNFYSKKKNFGAAAQRYNDVLVQYTDTKYYEEALYLLGKSYYELGEFGLAQDTLSRVEQFPDAKYQKKASELLLKIEHSEKNDSKK